MRTSRPSEREIKLAQLIIENSSANVKRPHKELMLQAGYSAKTAPLPGRTMRQEGVRRALTYLGFSEIGAKRVVSEIMYSQKVKPDTRLDAAREVFKVYGSYAPEKTANMNMNMEMMSNPTEDDKAAIAEFHAQLKANMQKRSMDKAKVEGDIPQ